MTTVNYIFVTAISSTNQKQTVADIKMDMRAIKSDLMNQLKEQHVGDTGAYNDIVSQIKEVSQGMSEQHSMMIDWIKMNSNSGNKN